MVPPEEKYRHKLKTCFYRTGDAMGESSFLFLFKLFLALMKFLFF